MPTNGSGSPHAMFDDPGTTSTGLLQRVSAGDEEAWGRVVALYGPLVYEWCRRASLQAEDAADVAQDVFGSLTIALKNFRRERPGDTFRGWLWTVTQNKIRDFFRRRQGKPLASGGTAAMEQLAQIADDPATTASAGPPANEVLRLRRRALEIVRAGVEERTWRAFWRVVVDGCSVSDVAAELGLTSQAVYDAKYRLRRKIRQELEGLDE